MFSSSAYISVGKAACRNSRRKEEGASKAWRLSTGIMSSKATAAAANQQDSHRKWRTMTGLPLLFFYFICDTLAAISKRTIQILPNVVFHKNSWQIKEKEQKDGIKYCITWLGFCSTPLVFFNNSAVALKYRFYVLNPLIVTLSLPESNEGINLVCACVLKYNSDSTPKTSTSSLCLLTRKGWKMFTNSEVFTNFSLIPLQVVKAQKPPKSLWARPPQMKFHHWCPLKSRRFLMQCSKTLQLTAQNAL